MSYHSVSNSSHSVSNSSIYPNLYPEIPGTPANNPYVNNSNVIYVCIMHSAPPLDATPTQQQQAQPAQPSAPLAQRQVTPITNDQIKEIKDALMLVDQKNRRAEAYAIGVGGILFAASVAAGL